MDICVQQHVFVCEHNTQPFYLGTLTVQYHGHLATMSVYVSVYFQAFSLPYKSGKITMQTFQRQQNICP